MNNPTTVDRRDVARVTNPLNSNKQIEREDPGQPLDAGPDKLPAAGKGLAPQPVPRGAGMQDRIRNSAADPDIGMRRSGGSHGDPHGGHNEIDNEWRTPDADPPDEMVPTGAGEMAPTHKGSAAAAGYTGIQKPNLPDETDAEARTSFEQPVEGAENKLRINQQTHLPENITPDGS